MDLTHSALSPQHSTESFRNYEETMLTTLDVFPPELLDIPATESHRYLSGPTLIHLPGRRTSPLFVTALLHGNEDTGFQAVQALLKNYPDRELPRALSIFIGNVQAAREGVRRLDGQPDYNRIWPGAEAPASPESLMMEEITAIMARRQVFASVDLHNNTGLNPHYGCVNKLDPLFLQLANLFSRTVVYFTRPKGVQSMAFARYCPAVTLECGRPGQPHGLEHATEYLDACLNLAEIPDHPVAEQDIDLFHTVAQVLVPEHVTFSFRDRGVHITFDEDLDHFNFQELPAGTTLGTANGDDLLHVTAHDEQGRDVTEKYFTLRDGRLTLKRPVMPSMFTLDERIIRQDCLCYLMERMRLEEEKQNG